MRVLTFSQSFPKGHIRAGEPTFFVEKICSALISNFIPQSKITPDFNWAQFQDCKLPKLTTIRSGNRWKAGDMASLRVWSGKPYNSKQIEFAQVEVKKVWKFEIKRLDLKDIGVFIDGDLKAIFHPSNSPLKEIARNDGLSIEDFISWFSIHPKKTGAGFKGQIISWHDNLKY